MIDLQDMKIKNSADWDSICPFPVGFVYMSTSKTSPATTYGGQWTSIAGNRFPRFVSTTSNALAQGGTAQHRHLTTTGKANGEHVLYIADNDQNYNESKTDPVTGSQMDAYFYNGASVITPSGPKGNAFDVNEIPGMSLINSTPTRLGPTGRATHTPPLYRLLCVVSNRVKSFAGVV